MEVDTKALNIKKRIFSRKKPIIFGLIMLGSANVIYSIIPLIIKNIIDSLKNITSFTPDTIRNFIYFLILSLFGTLFFTLGRLTIISISRWMEKDIREAVFRKILTMPGQFFDHNLNGHIYTRITSDIRTISMTAAATMIVFVSSSMMFIPVFVFVLTLNLKLTAVLLIPYPILAFWMFFITRKVRDKFTTLQEKRDALNGMVQENLNGIFIVKSYVIEELEKARFEKYNNELFIEGVSLSKLTNWFWPIIGGFIGLSIGLITYFGGTWVISGEITLGVLVAFLNYSMLMIGPTLGIGWVLSLIQRGKASLTRINQMLGMSINPALVDEGNNKSDLNLDSHNISFSIRNMDYSYPPGDEYFFNPENNDTNNSNTFSLQDISLTIKKQEKILITGSIGCGKSTLIQLLLRQWEPPAASIFIEIDDKEYDILDIPVYQLRKIISVVPQESFLFSKTIEDNITLGSELLDKEPETIVNISENACFHCEVKKFTNKYKTLVGEKGVTLSGGQRQRCAISRSLFVSPAFLVLDDSLSSLDVKTQMTFMDNLEQHYKDTAIILITHKVSLVKRFEKIIFMGTGNILAFGTHEELMEQCEKYKEFYLRDTTYGG